VTAAITGARGVRRWTKKRRDRRVHAVGMTARAISGVFARHAHRGDNAERLNGSSASKFVGDTRDLRLPPTTSTPCVRLRITELKKCGMAKAGDALVFDGGIFFGRYCQSPTTVAMIIVP